MHNNAMLKSCFLPKVRLGHAGAVQSASRKTSLSNGTGSAFLSLETFERVAQHISKQPKTPHSCAWPTYLRIYLSIHPSIHLAL